MKTCVTVTVTVLLFALNTMAGAIAPSEVSKTAKWAIHMDASRLRDTDMGRHMLAQADTDACQDRMAAFKAMVNFDPRTDLESLTLYGTDGGKHNGVAILHGTFDGGRLATLARANDTYQAEQYAGVTIHSWIGMKHSSRHGNGRTFGCILSANTLAFSRSRDMLVLGLDVLGRRAPSLADGDALADLLNIDARYFLSAAAEMGDMQNISPRAALLRNTDNAVIAIGENAGMMQAAVEMTTSTPDAALNLSRMLNGMIGMAMLNAEGNPGMAAIAKATSVSLEDATLSVTLEMPVKDILDQLETMKCHK